MIRFGGEHKDHQEGTKDAYSEYPLFHLRRLIFYSEIL